MTEKERLSPIHIVQKAIIKDGDKFLILKRSPDAQAFPNHWDFPGGKLEVGESPDSGIIREILEETNLVADTVKEIGKFCYDFNGKGISTHEFRLYEASVSGMDVKISFEHTEFRWSTINEILTLEIEPYMRDYFKQFGSDKL